MSSRLFKILEGKFTKDEIQRLLPLFGNSQRDVADFYKEYRQDKLRELLSSGQGQSQGQGGQQQQLKALIISLGGVPQTSNIQQLKKLLAQTQRIHKLREIIPSMPEDTLTYLLSKGLNDEEVVEIGLNIPEKDINFMVECVPALINKQTLFDKLIQGGKLIPGGVARLHELVVKNRNVVDNLSKTTKFSRGAIPKLLKKGCNPDDIVIISYSLQSFQGALASDKLNHVTNYSEEDRIKDDTLHTLAEKGLTNYQIIEVALSFTEGDLDFMVRSFPKIKDKQTLLNDIVKKILEDGTIVKIKEALEKRKRDVKELSQTTGLSEDEIIQLFGAGKKKQVIQKMRGGQQQQPKKKRKLPPQQELQQLKTILQTQHITLDDDTLKHLLRKGMNAQRILRFGKNFNKYFPKYEQEETLQFFRLMDPDLRTKQDYIDKLLTIPPHQMETFKELIQRVRDISERTQMTPEEIVKLLHIGKSPQEILRQFTSSTDRGTMGEGQKPKQRQSTFLDQSIITFLRKKGFKDTQIEAFAEDDKRFGFKKMFHEAKQTFPEINTKQDFVTSLLQKYHPEDWVTFLRDRKDSVERMCDLNDLNRKDEQVIRVIKAFYKQGMDQSTIGKRLRQTPKQRHQRQRRGGMITSPQMIADQKKGGGVQQSKSPR